MKYDLPKAPDGYRTDLALIIAPYFDLWFGRRIVKQLKPRRIRFIVDDGARDEDVRQLLQACGAGDIKIALGRAAGIVHLKGYYLEFMKSEGRSQRKRRFIFGSANATQAAFSGETNAELIAGVDLSGEENAEILQYLMTILSAVESGSGLIKTTRTQATRNVPKLFLPGFQVRPMGPAPGFDAWLQRGCLAAKYRDAQQFMTIAVTLNKPLPPGSVAQQFQTQGLIQQGARNVVRYRYIGLAAPDNENDDDAVGQWKARYCVWTHLGDWLSEECYESKHDSMVSKSKPERQVRIKELLDYRQDSAWKNERKRLFLNAMDGVWKALLSTNVSPSDYLKGHGQGIDHSHYGTQFDKKVSADLVLAQDASFHARYINGYEFPDVPRFRQDADAWQEFVRSFCESVAVEAGKKGTRSLITKVIRAAVEPSNLLELKPDEIRDKLRVSWNGDKVGDGVWAKYTNGYFYPGRITGIVSKSDGRYFTIKYDDGDDGEVRSDGIRSAGYDITRYFEEDQPDA